MLIQKLINFYLLFCRRYIIDPRGDKRTKLWSLINLFNLRADHLQEGGNDVNPPKELQHGANGNG